ncbi:MAG: hypothetical protein KDI32_06800 [Pseudomonadales bacterium]|nr:hypothetical protein [Pseudomonadales bacterium]
MKAPDRQPMRRSVRGGRPYFFADPATDKILSMVVTLASEVWALRERVMAMEAIGAKRGTFKPGEVDAYEFAPALEQRLAAERQEFIASLFRVLEELVPKKSATRKNARKTAKKKR